MKRLNVDEHVAECVPLDFEVVAILLQSVAPRYPQVIESYSSIEDRSLS
jgi:hypothetical protein